MLSVYALSNRSHDQVVTVTVGRPGGVDPQQTQQESIYGALPHGRTIIMGRRASPADCASYLRGSGTRDLLFMYRVKPPEFDEDGLKVGSAASGEDGTSAYGFKKALPLRMPCCTCRGRDRTVRRSRRRHARSACPGGAARGDQAGCGVTASESPHTPRDRFLLR